MIFTDGSCVGEPDRRTGHRAGGWAAVIVEGGALGDAGRQMVLAGGVRQTTNNRMELTAAIEALRAVTAGSVTVVSDSRYLVDGAARLASLKSRGWKTPAGRRVPNRDLWQALDALSVECAIEWRWAKGHSGLPESDLADRLARQEAERERALDL